MLRLKLRRNHGSVTLPDPIDNGATRQAPGRIGGDDFTSGLAQWIVDNGQWSLSAGYLNGQNPDNFGGAFPPGHGRLIFAPLGFALTAVCMQLDTLHQKLGGFPCWLDIAVRNTAGGLDKEIGFESNLGGSLGTIDEVCVIGDVQNNSYTVLGSSQRLEEVWVTQKLYVNAVTGRVQSWVNQPDTNQWLDFLSSDVVAVPATFQAEIKMKNDGNDKPGMAKATRFVMMRKNTIDLVGIPNGTVVVNVWGGADSVVAMNVLGLGTFDPGGLKFPASIRYRFRDAVAAVIADVTIPNSYGGDTVGFAPVPPIDPNNFTLSRTSTGLLFSDDFNRADGPPGANYTAIAGVWVIAGNKLSVTTTTLNDRLEVTGLGNVQNAYVQVKANRASLLNYAGFNMRHFTTGYTFWYQIDTGASTDGDADRPRGYSHLNGSYFKIAVGAPGQSGAAGADALLQASALGSPTVVRFGSNGLVAQNTDPNPQSEVAGKLELYAQAQNPGGTLGLTVTFENLVVCSSENIIISNIPDNWKVRIAGVPDSAAAADGLVVVNTFGLEMPFTDIRILDDTGTEVKTLTPAGGVFCGDVYALA